MCFMNNIYAIHYFKVIFAEGTLHKYVGQTFKVAYTSGPFFEKFMKRYPIFS